MQDISASIVVISIALLATTLVLISPTWRGLLSYVQLLSAEGWQDIKTPLFYALVLSTLVFGAAVAMGIVGPVLVQSVVLLVMMGICVLGICYFIVISLWRFVRRQPLIDGGQPQQSDLESWEKYGAMAYTASLAHLVLAAALLAICMLESIDTAVDISLGPNTQDSFEFARWTIRAAIPAFFVGLLLLGCGKFVDFWRLHATANIPVNGSGDNVLEMEQVP